jgi:hypothetical protein
MSWQVILTVCVAIDDWNRRNASLSATRRLESSHAKLPPLEDITYHINNVAGCGWDDEPGPP